MRQLTILLALFIIPNMGWSQVGDTPKSKPLKIEVANKKDEQGKEQKGTALRMPDIVGNKPEINFKDSLAGKKPIKMYPDRELVQAGTGMKIDPKVGPRENEKEGSKNYFGDMYLGEVKSNGKFVGVVCRDHEYVDGDRVRIYLNGDVIDPNVMLSGTFKGINVDLKKGFNRLEFEALNEGSSSPNTAQVDVYDDQGQLIYSNKWLLSAKSKASLIITKE
ncbi:hypothetical protein FGM00_00175 [Aggregatimonas sangjinii]|uniref:Secreted protein n=1 Tax=Aggregatimonas sangjinii TaxID=2583587 RepID=A0A5B7SNN3_9FLAO|nr:hypothetical protein [Aggregatimonas sangjinii]QCW98610.1 hypothetical protein FGM00_00175 [Aggregatimonas sangjinii]